MTLEMKQKYEGMPIHEIEKKQNRIKHFKALNYKDNTKKDGNEEK